jgi:hypothetical protein
MNFMEKLEEQVQEFISNNDIHDNVAASILLIMGIIGLCALAYYVIRVS